jgi:hypothetical protein
MKRAIHFLLFGVFLLVGFVAVAPAAHADGCTMRNAAGQYGFTLTGVLITPNGAIPAAAVGHATVDFTGRISGTEARNVGGVYADETLSGTLTVNSDCTGSMTLNVYQAGQLVRTSVLSIVFVNNQQELRMVQKSLTLPDGRSVPAVITVDARKTSDE